MKKPFIIAACLACPLFALAADSPKEEIRRAIVPQAVSAPAEHRNPTRRESETKSKVPQIQGSPQMISETQSVGEPLEPLRKPEILADLALPETAEKGTGNATAALLPDLSEKTSSGPVNISNAGALEMSDEVVPFEQFARGRPEQYRTVTEQIDDLIFASNRERRELIEQRATDDSDTEIPDRKSLFGGDRFLSPGPIHPGFKMPGGATWRPTFMAFGTLRSAMQTFQRGTTDVSEWVNRLDLFGNIYLTGTERILIGFRPFDRNGDFTGYTLAGGSRPEGWNHRFNMVPQTLFFEGDFGELFPFLDPQDKRRLDYQFSIGRQPVIMQDGMMMNDSIDALAITRHNIYMLGASNTRVTGWFGVNQINRGNNIEDQGAKLFAVSTTLDYAGFTLETDAAYVKGSRSTGGDGAYLGIGHIRRIGHWGSTLRANASWSLDDHTPAVNNGYIFTHELSRTLPGSSDIVYLNTFIGVDNYTSAARDPATGGPLGRMGLMNRAVGLGSYGAPLSNRSGDSIGASIGFQHFFDAAAYHQLLVEIGARKGYDSNPEPLTGAIGAQYQWGISRGLIWILGGFASLDEKGTTGYGGRSEMMVKF